MAELELLLHRQRPTSQIFSLGHLTFKKNWPAIVTPEETITSLGTAAKYATLTSMYETVTIARAVGPAISIVFPGLLSSDKTYSINLHEKETNIIRTLPSRV